MLPPRDAPTRDAQPLSREGGCVEFPLLLLHEHLTELEHQAWSRKQTIGQMIRQAIGPALAGSRGRSDFGGDWSDFQPHPTPDSPDSPGVIAVTLLLTVSQFGELEALAFDFDTTTGALIRRVICCSILQIGRTQQSANEATWT